VVKKKSKVGKNPDVDTSFLPDKEREEEERQERERLRREWLALQEKIKRRASKSVWISDSPCSSVPPVADILLMNFISL
jgi:hypothetical protein